MQPRIARWWLWLQEYDFDIRHCPGSQTWYVKLPSRNGVGEPAVANLQVMAVHITNDDWLIMMQTQDPDVREIRKTLQIPPDGDKAKQVHTDYTLREVGAYKKVEGANRWLVSKGLQQHVIRQADDNIGHFGVEKTLKHLRQIYWFARMRQCVKRYINLCVECACHPIPKVAVPFHTIHWGLI